ncbi:MAG: hypothetical protein H7A51_02250 [Akkermansiaceae bacterium]|nr:hypothetical protein [Akkermansiaceae bacterium]
MPHLPVASAAHKIQGKQVHFIEVQTSHLGWNVQGGTTTDDLEKIENQIKAARENFHSQGHNPVVLIEADEGLAFKKVRAAIRTAAKAGIDVFLFAVRQHPMHPDALEYALAFDTQISMGYGCGLPVIASMLIKVDRHGWVYVHSGPGQELINATPESHELPGLRQRIQAYQAVARAGAQEPVFQVWIDGEAPYQRYIDLINLLRSHGIEREIYVDLMEDTGGVTGCKLPSPPAPPRLPRAPRISNPITE